MRRAQVLAIALVTCLSAPVLVRGQGPARRPPASPASPGPSPAPAPARRSLSAKVARIVGDVLVRTDGQEWAPATEGQGLGSNDELSTGPDSTATVSFSDGSTMEVKELTRILIGDLLSREDRIKIRVLLKMGELKAQVNHQETIRSDFSIKTPTATASVRGTRINRVSFSPARGMETQLASGRLLVESPRGRALTQGTDQAQVNALGGFTGPTELMREETRIHVEPVGLTAPEVQQITATNQPQAQTISTSSDTSRTNQTGGGTLIFRYVLQ